MKSNKRYYEIGNEFNGVFLMREDKTREIAFSENGYAIIGIGYCEEDRLAVQEFADLYDLQIVA